jgi:NAD(P)-dependent dehydrogenase (short-subunit alcohol dehydrogenase family)
MTHAGHDRLDGRIAIVTGAAQGIGEAIARAMARAGASVLLADLQSDRAADVAASIRTDGAEASATFVDVADPASAESLIATCLERHDRVDVLVNNAGIDAPPGAAWEIDAEHWRRVIGTNPSGAWWCTSAVLPHMRERASGRVIFISSGSARIGDPGISVAYNASKAGLIGLTIGLSVHLERFGILVNAIAPGYTGTGEPMSEEERETYEAEHPLGIVGPEPIADACVYLAGRAGDWITGAVMNVSGGWWRGW